jgi:drug/metabolite transporter (DMT)-like permease
MSASRIAMLTVVAMLAFASNSLLCRLAMRDAGMDPVLFTLVRIAAAAAMLALWQGARGRLWPVRSDLPSAIALFLYAIAFSVAYVQLPAGTGALLLIGGVQVTMIGWGLWRGERLLPGQWAGLAIALAGLIALLLPGIASPAPVSAALMVVAGASWGAYSVRGKNAADPLAATAGNFLLALPLAVTAALIVGIDGGSSRPGLSYAITSGALTSGAGYVVWYAAVRQLNATTAATAQLSVPVITAAGGVVLLGERLTLTLVFAAIAVLGGIALVAMRPGKPSTSAQAGVPTPPERMD